ncbi:hypothetical protein LXM25_11785 [Dyadobacter sp. LJ53]|uniref:hypothetical protein n=1 Tax=Dyadobacter chenwenxiniae TaxID=2906456 RepID=UPI001F2382D5|nr:hypothetical protein [Dyadobacter chenwenxiniae]MCF0050743.1 hypothetical protein [Dyadobacter chenwenxiniae]
MPTIIYDDKQKKAINLDNVDTIKLDRSGAGFHIVFQKQITVKDSYMSTTLDRWVYGSEDERDKVFRTIIDSYGYRVGGWM